MSVRIVEPPLRPFSATVRVPGDKSLSHRALLFAAMAGGTSRVSGLGPGADVASTSAILRKLGVEIGGERVDSPGVEQWRASPDPLDCGNSGTTMRLLAGALSGRPFRSTLDGDASLRSRPMRRLVAPLGELGARVEVSSDGTPPLVVGGGDLYGARVEIPLATAQVRSAVALAALQAEGPTTIVSPPGYRDHTERWLSTLGRGTSTAPTEFRVEPGAIPAAEYEIPGDTSSAAYLWAAAATVPGSRVTTPEISLNAGRLGFLEVLERMGATVTAEVTGDIYGDPIGSVTVVGGELRATEVSGSLVTATIDELPLVAVLGTYAEGVTVVRDAAELREKESDRVESTVEMIRMLGGAAEPAADGFSVLGVGFVEAGAVTSAGDHRLAMAAAVAAAGARGPVTIDGAEAVAVSWPEFFDDLEFMWSSSQ